MGDFVQRAVTRSAQRTLASPIESIAAFAAIVENVLVNNPFGCTPYQSGGETLPAVEKTREGYTARIVFQDGDARTVGTVTVRSPTIAAHAANVTAVMESAAIASAMGGTPVHATEDDSFSTTLRCHDPNGEVYTVGFNRNRVTISSYEDDAIRAAVEAWADTVPALA
ncbi:MAG TPA: hypothetical protein PK089_06920 [Methanoregulaceae archaeon]|nr:hypothetical protein [Methanoregulaceae archaeon]HOV67265.1 hypothetical protein [Methanoregulaceae archaeon]HQJ88896.1 hypothetical protein [Methanoregulaceae archaeon]